MGVVSPISDEPLVLASRYPIAIGGRRLVYEHPADPSILIKVPRPEKAAKANAWRHRFKRFAHLDEAFREVREYMALKARLPQSTLPVASIRGFVDTDLGFGLCYQAIRNHDGSLCPTIEQILNAGLLDDHRRAAIEAFCSWLVVAPVVVRDLSVRNVVLREMPKSVDAVLVDGLGERTLVPIRSMVPALNQHARAFSDQVA